MSKPEPREQKKESLISRLRDVDWFYILMPVVQTIWYTILCGGFAYVYWFTGFVDPRDIFPDLLGHIGALVVFPVGWIALIINTWDV